MSDLGNKEIFAKNLKYYMDLNGKDRNDVCRDLGFPYTTFAEWYNGNIYPRIDKIELLARYFGIEKSDLIEEKINKTPDKPTPIPVLGRISAGLPLLAAEHLEGLEFAPSTFLKNGFDYFYLKVKGDSMNQKFNDGDLVLVQKQDELENGDIGVVLVNGDDATIKRYKNENGLVVLEPMSTNPIHSVQIYNPKDISIRIVGKAIISVSNL